MGPILADLVTPLLYGLLILAAIREGRVSVMVRGLLISLPLILLWSPLEQQLGLWFVMGMDYSTHTAILLPVFHLLLLFWWQASAEDSAKGRFSGSLFLIALVLGFGYGGLMQHLGYHTLEDMITTVLATYPVVWLLMRTRFVGLKSGRR